MDKRIVGDWYCGVSRSNREALRLGQDGSFALEDLRVFNAFLGTNVTGKWAVSGDTLELTSEKGNVRCFNYRVSEDVLTLRPAADDVLWYTDGLYAMEPRTGEVEYTRTEELPDVRTAPVGKADAKVGWARIEITPKPEHFGDPAALAVHAPLFATVVWVEASGDHHALAICDLLGICGPARRLIGAEVANSVGVRPETLVTGVTHTHNAPMVVPAYGKSLGVTGLADINDSYAPYLAARLGEASAEAYGNRERALYSFGRGLVTGVASSRRVYGAPGVFGAACVGKEFGVGLIDPEVSVLAFERASDRHDKLILYTYASHPVGYPDSYNVMSQDMWGVASGEIEDFLPPGKSMVQGAVGTGGSSNPRMFMEGQRGWAEAARLGGRMADGIKAALAAMRPAEALESLRFGVQDVRMKAGSALDNTRDLAFDKMSYEEHVRAFQSEPTVDNYYMADMMRDVVDGEVRRSVTAWVLNDKTAVVFYPDEASVQYGLETKKYSPWAETVVLGYCNDYGIYYVMPGGDQKQGGWEPSHTNVAIGEGDKLLDAGLTLLQRLDGR